MASVTIISSSEDSSPPQNVRRSPRFRKPKEVEAQIFSLPKEAAASRKRAHSIEPSSKETDKVEETAFRRLPKRQRQLPARFREEEEKQAAPEVKKVKKRLLPCRLPRGVHYTPFSTVHPDFRAKFAKFWAKVGQDLIPKKVGVELRKFQLSCDRIVRDGDDSYFSSKVRVQKINENVGYGVFAKERINTGSVIGIYGGELRRFDDVDEADGNGFVFGFQDTPELKGWYVDGRRCTNFTAFMNHANPDSVHCNVVPVEYLGEEGPMIVFVATKTICPMDQLLYNYGDHYWRNLGIRPEIL